MSLHVADTQDGRAVEHEDVALAERGGSPPRIGRDVSEHALPHTGYRGPCDRRGHRPHAGPDDARRLPDSDHRA